MMRCVLRTNWSAQDLLSVRLRSDVALDADVKRVGSVKLIEHSMPPSSADEQLAGTLIMKNQRV